jgi:hypothetical protein
VYFLICFKYQTKDDRCNVETFSRLTNYFSEIVYLEVLNLMLLIKHPTYSTQMYSGSECWIQREGEWVMGMKQKNQE